MSSSSKTQQTVDGLRPGSGTSTAVHPSSGRVWTAPGLPSSPPSQARHAPPSLGAWQAGASSSRTGLLQELDDLVVAPLAGMAQRGHALAIGQVHIGAGFDEEADHLGMARATITQDDGLQQRRPAQAIYVIAVD